MAELTRLLKLLDDHPALAQGAARAPRGEQTLDLGGLPTGAVSYYAAALNQRIGKRPLLLISPDGESAEELAASLTAFTDEVLFYPAWELLPYELHSPELATVAERLDTLFRLNHGYTGIVVSTPRALMRRVLPAEKLFADALELLVEQELAPNELSEKLNRLGYRRLSMVEAPGEYARRGGLLDVFPSGAVEPVRLDYYGDFIETIRHFDPATQRSGKVIERVLLLPRFETQLDEAAIEELLQELPRGEERAELESVLRRNLHFEGLELFTGRFSPQLAAPLDYFSVAPLTALVNGNLCQAKAESFTSEISGQYERRRSAPPLLTSDGITSGLNPHPLDGLSEEGYSEAKAEAVEIKGLPLEPPTPETSFTSGEDFLAGSSREIVLPTKTLEPYHGKIGSLFTDLRRWDSEGWTTVLCCRTKGKLERLEEILADEELSPPVVLCELAGGTLLPDLKLALITDDELFGRVAPLSRHRRLPVTNFDTFRALELREGDYVIHDDHGIGRYLGLSKQNIGGEEADFVKLAFRDGANLYVPIWNLSALEKYETSESRGVSLDKLGGTRWKKAQKRIKHAVASLARELIEVHAQREATPGHSFAPDNNWQRELEQSFPFTDTPDQQQATVEVKAEMEKTHPMDHLLCGDVGFGKTEVAVRAAFKAVMDAKQVAILVPTTILAEQHRDTFRTRMAPFPVRVEMLSRFVNPADQRETIAAAARGEVDILIGTHRLLSQDVKFKNLGLLIIDEEQRFGVKHKELLKQLQQQVDVLTLTATPIPRTLYLAMMGARGLSTIQTPPVGRYPVKTFIGETSNKLIVEAISRELDRGGQVFFVHNRVQSISNVAAFLQELMPDVRFGIAHGQMAPRRLEAIMHDFIHHNYDVLVCTTIIENGTDIPNANTIIINRADRFGLSQLYQLRGRVGRSRHRAYAYLFTPPKMIIGELAWKRLKSVAEFNELGSGYRLAMKDLELRGAGDVLGPAQSGFIEQVGFDLYVRMLKEAVAELKGDTSKRARPKTQVSGDFPAFLPDDYVGSPELKLRLYRQLAEVVSLSEAEDLRLEFLDRFGELPETVENLFAALAVKLLGDGLGVNEVRIKKQRLSFTFDNFATVGRIALGKVDAVDGLLPRVGKHGTGVLEARARIAPLEAARELLLAMTEAAQK